jgi:TonB family protein
MTNPNNPRDADFRGTLPADLQELDRELSGIRIEERPSFAPELEGELTRAWRVRPEGGFRRRRPWVRNLIAAGLAGLMIAGVSVPSARAAVVTLVRNVVQEVFPDLLTPPVVPEVLLPEIEVQEPVPSLPEPRTEVTVSAMDVSDEVEETQPELQLLPDVRITLPAIASRQDATATIAAHYPKDLQEEGIEGSVKLQFWVNTMGQPEFINIREGSGNARLDRAATLAAREIEFIPATRNGVPVGTWVEVQIHFFALTGIGVIGSDSMNSGV